VIGNDELELSSSTIGFALGVGAAARFLSAWVAGVGSDRLSRKVVLVPSLLLMALGAGVLTLSPSVVAWMAAIVLLATGSSGISVAAAALADRVSERRLGHELGLFRLLGGLSLPAIRPGSSRSRLGRRPGHRGGGRGPPRARARTGFHAAGGRGGARVTTIVCRRATWPAKMRPVGMSERVCG
jgi:Major Facilitator Superfamily